MKRGCQNRDKVRSQAIQYRQQVHYGRVEEVGRDRQKKEERANRIDILVQKGISKEVGLRMSGGITVPIRQITMQGIIVLDNNDEIDPLNL
ncbi:MAG: hypothetical protein WC022_03275 [Parcubacteria group bacterium]